MLAAGTASSCAAVTKQQGGRAGVPAGCPRRPRCQLDAFVTHPPSPPYLKRAPPCAWLVGRRPARMSAAPAQVGEPAGELTRCCMHAGLQGVCPAGRSPCTTCRQPCRSCRCVAGPPAEDNKGIANLDATEDAVPALSPVAGTPAAVAAATEPEPSPGAPPTSAPDDRAGRPTASSGSSSRSSSKGAAGAQAAEPDGEERGVAVTGTGRVSSSVRTRKVCASPSGSPSDLVA